MEKRKTKKYINYSLEAIDLISNSINVPQNFDASDEHGLTFGLELKSTIKIDEELLIIEINYEFLKDAITVFNIVVQNIFKIDRIKNYVKNEQIEQKEFYEFLVELSINHTRGVQSQLLKNTPLARFYIPFIDVLDILGSEVRST